MAPTPVTPALKSAPPSVTLVFVAAADPLVRHHGGAGRDFPYRIRLLLKRALRDLGLRCVAARDVQPGDPTTVSATLGE